METRLGTPLIINSMKATEKNSHPGRSDFAFLDFIQMGYI